MNALLLIPWPQTGWSEAGRIASRTPLPLSESGRNQAHAWAVGFADAGLKVVYSSKEQVSVETARIVADRTGAKHKTVPELAEVDAGLWDGLTADELKHRYPKVFKRWREDPASVCPPEGEDMSAAFERLREPVDRVTQKPGNSPVGLVLGPLAFALVRCMIESVGPTRLRALMHDVPLRYEPNGKDGVFGPAVTLDAAD